MRTSLGGVLSFLKRLSPEPSRDGEDDGRLLARFVQGDGVAFTTLVGRYAPLVWGVCRRLLGPSADAEDAFQATFVVLVRKAESLADGRSIGPWLHKVASRTATKARARSAKRGARETSVEVDPATHEEPELHRRELGAILEEEVSRLPERYRAPVVLCYLEGLTNEEAARRLECPKGTILSRLSRAREQLRERLTRRGLDFSAVVLPAALASPDVPAGLAEAAVQAGALRAGGAAGVSAAVLVLAEGVMMSMFLRKLEVIGGVVLLLALTAGGVGWLTSKPMVATAAAEEPPARVAEKPPAKAEAKVEAKVDKGASLDALLAKLPEVFEFPGIDDPRTTLGEALDQFSRICKVSFDVNEKAFGEAGLNDVLKTPIAEKPLILGKLALRVALKLVLARVPGDAGILVRNHAIEITTLQRTHMELRKAGEPQTTELAMVFTRFRDVPLRDALEQLGEANNANVVIDARVIDQLKGNVTARLINVEVETAAKVLADMAGLSVVRKQNVLYVTSRSNAKQMLKEMMEDE